MAVIVGSVRGLPSAGLARAFVTFPGCIISMSAQVNFFPFDCEGVERLGLGTVEALYIFLFLLPATVHVDGVSVVCVATSAIAVV